MAVTRPNCLVPDWSVVPARATATVPVAAEVRSTANGWHVRDLGSTNGTFLNGTRLGPGEWPIFHNDILRCGNVTWSSSGDYQGDDPACDTIV